MKRRCDAGISCQRRWWSDWSQVWWLRHSGWRWRGRKHCGTNSSADCTAGSRCSRGTGLGAAAGGLSLWMVRRLAPETAGSGIPHLQAVLLGKAVLNWRRLLPVKFIAGVIGIGGGLTLGREGPTVQMGGASGLMVADWFRVKAGGGERKALISAGAGAGLAAAFNSPLAGMIFVLEELQGNFTPVVFVAAFLASVSSDVVSRLLVADKPVFHLEAMPSMGVDELPFALLLGLLAGLLGVVFNKCLLGSLDGFDRITRSKWLGGVLAGMVAGIAGWCTCPTFPVEAARWRIRPSPERSRWASCRCCCSRASS
ncbi:MAG: chloride channel protein [Luteolibacter sp.]